MTRSKKNFTLREKKYAKTKIALANAFIERLKKTRFNDISIKEVCESVEVSESTFFNYFPQKIDVVIYYKQQVGLTTTYNALKNADTMSPQELIGSIFDDIAREINQPYLFYEMVSLFTAEKQRPANITLDPAEKYYAHPQCEGIEDVPVQSLEETFLYMIKECKKRGELRKNIKPDDVVLMLITILIGTPLAIDIKDFGKLRAQYRLELSLLWKALEAR